MKDEPTFFGLIQSIQAAHREMAAQAGKAVNISLTLRNWLIGYHIAEYELNGKDRAEYGENLLHRISTELLKAKIPSCGKRQLYGYFRFYQAYPQIVGTLSPQFKPEAFQEVIDSENVSQKVRTLSALSGIDPQKLISTLSYTHFEHLIAIDDPTKRAFYETECIQGNWSVRELKRQSGICVGRDGQPLVCLQIPAGTSHKGRDATIY